MKIKIANQMLLEKLFTARFFLADALK